MALILPPQWFFASDLIIDFFSFIVLLAFTIISLSYYKISKNRSFFYLGISFLLICLGQFFEIFMNLKIYYDLTNMFHLGNVIIASHVAKPLQIVNYLGGLFYRLFVLIGFYFLYYASKKEHKIQKFEKSSRWNHLVIVYLLIVLAVLTSTAFQFFAITVALFSVIIFFNYNRVYRETGSKNSLVLAISFIILFVSYMVLAFVTMSPTTYILANVLQLVAFIMLLYLMICIFYHGRQLKKN